MAWFQPTGLCMLADAGFLARRRGGLRWLPGQFLGRLSGWRADLAAVLLGAISALALPPFHAVPILLLTVPGLLTLLGSADRARTAARVGFWFGFGCNLVGLYWITEAILVEAARFWWFVPLAVPLTSVVMAVFIAAACVVGWLAPAGGRRLVALAGAWVLADLAREFVGTGFPWNPWGSVWELPGAAGDVFIQPAAWVSVHGLTAATIVLAGVPSLGIRSWLAGAIGLAAWGGCGMWRLSWPEPVPPGVSVVLVQGNVAEGQKWDRSIAIATFRRHLALTRQGVAEAITANGRNRIVVVWPETASPFLLETDAGARQAIAEAANDGAASPVTALVGSVRLADGPHNSLFAITPDAGIAVIFDKFHLVPFGEYQPSWLPGIQVVPGGGFQPGPGPRTLALAGLPPVAPLICYEAIFPGQVVDPHARPAWLVNITNDAWFGDSSGPRQHLAAARMRAVEEGLPLVRAANTGISAGFDPHGRELGRLALDTAGVLVIVLPGAMPPTLFAGLGLLIPLGLGVLLVAAGLGSVVARRGRR